MRKEIPTADELRSKVTQQEVIEKQNKGYEILGKRLLIANKHGSKSEEIYCSYIRKNYCIDPYVLIDEFEKKGYTVDLCKNAYGGLESIIVRW